MEMQTNEYGINELNNELNQPEQSMTQSEEIEQPCRKKHHSSALYAASMWHSTVNHVKRPHTDGNFLPVQA